MKSAILALFSPKGTAAVNLGIPVQADRPRLEIAWALTISNAQAIICRMNINWSEIIKSIEAHGKTQSEIASVIGTSQGHISDLRNGRRGKNIGFEFGSRLLALRESLNTDDKKDVRSKLSRLELTGNGGGPARE